MQITSIKELLEHSFVITINNDRYVKFCNRFLMHNLTPLPKKFEGFKFKNKIYKYAGFIKTSNVINCSISHASIIKIAQYANMDYVCIFEDDAIPHNDIEKLLNNILPAVPNNVDILKLGTLGNKSTIYWQNDMFKSVELSYGTHAYIIFKKYYDKWFDFLYEDPIADSLPINNRQSNIIQTTTPLFVQEIDINTSMHSNSFEIDCFGLDFLKRNFKI